MHMTHRCLDRCIDYLGENAPLYGVVSKRFNEKVSEGALDVVTYLVMVDKDVYWNLLVTLSYLG